MIPQFDYAPLPYAGRRYTPDTARLSAIFGQGGQQLAALSLEKGRTQAETLNRLAAIISSGIGDVREGRARKENMAVSAANRAADEKLKRDEMAERKAEREQAEKDRKETQDRTAAERLADNLAPGQVADPSALRAIDQFSKQFPEFAARFQRGQTLPATPMSGEMAPPSEVVARIPTGAEAMAAGDRRFRVETEAGRQKERLIDNAARDAAQARGIRHEQVMEGIAERNAEKVSNTPVVVQTADGPAVLDRRTLTAQPITMGGKSVGPAPSAQERMDSRKFAKAAPVLDGIEALSEKINTQQGIIAKMSGETEKQKAKLNLNDDVAEYQSLVSAFTPLIARSLGHTGVLTQQDVDSVKEVFPKPGDSKSLRDRKMKRIRGIFSELEGTEHVPDVAPGTPAVKVLSITPVKQ